MSGAERNSAWWQARWVPWLAIALCAVPLLGPAVPPLVDVPGHIGRYFVMLHGDASAALVAGYAFEWRLVGNLGVDLVVWLLGQAMPVEPATKLAVIGIALLTGAGMLAVAREVHGRVPPTAYLALPLVYSYPFQFGFLNYALAIALALLALALWLNLARRGRLWLRAALFVPIAFVLFVVHLSGWGAFCLMAAGAEFARLRYGGADLRRAALGTVLAGLPLVPPALIVLLGARDPHAVTYDWFFWQAKLQWVLSILRESHAAFDIASVLALLTAAYFGATRLGLDNRLALPALLCGVTFLVMPRVLMNGTYADMRLIPLALTLTLLAIRPAAGLRSERWFAVGSLTFFLLRLTATTADFATIAKGQQRELAALAAIPRGATVLALVARPCSAWATARTEHIVSLAIPRRQAFVNDQWAIHGQQLLAIRRTDLAPLDRDPSQIVAGPECRNVFPTTLAFASAHFNRAAVTHVWTVGIPPRRLAPDLKLIWGSADSAVYAVVRR